MSTSTTLAKNRKTPGVYITEFPSFPPSITGVATAVPIFIGYTETAADPATGKQLFNQAIAISSMVDYISYFGYGYSTVSDVAPAAGEDYDFQAPGLQVIDDKLVAVSKKYQVGQTDNGSVPKFNLYAAMQLFFSNGGGNCHVISVGNYVGQPGGLQLENAAAVAVKAKALRDGIDIAEAVKGGTMLVMPDACLLPAEEHLPLAVAMLKQAKKLQDRVAILDLPGALEASNWTAEKMRETTDDFCVGINSAEEAFSYGAAYGPALESSLLTIDDVDYTNLLGNAPQSQVLMNNLLTTQALASYPVDGNGEYTKKFKDIAARIAAAFPIDGATGKFGHPEGITGTVAGYPATPASTILVSLNQTGVLSPPKDDHPAVASLDQYLTNAVPLIGQIEQILASQLNVVPPSGVMAGVWSQNDANRGVWNAPANVSLNQIIAPKVLLNDEQQGDFNVPLNGNSVCILRSSTSRGTVVWGARTLDGNSLDYRYIQVRRTLNYLEQSIKAALQQFVFAPNDGGTWATVTAAISSFLTQVWQAGGLMGDKASDAFTVNCGTPTTMSALDVLNGYMIVSVTVQLIHPAEFIELTFKQTMQGA